MIYTNSKVQVTVNDPVKGRVAGKRERLSGTTGILMAIPNFRHKFKHWLDGQGNVVSTNAKLVINDWKTASYEAVFENIVLTHQDFVNHDAVETEVYYYQHHGLADPEKHYSQGKNKYGSGQVYNSTFYTPGNYPSGPATRTLMSGTVINTFPPTYGYNYRDLDTNSTGEELKSQGTYDAVTNTVGSDSVFHLDPTITPHAPASGIDVTRLTPYQSGIQPTISWLNQPVFGLRPRCGYDKYDDGSCGAWNYNNPLLGLYNNPTVGESQQYPLLKYSAIKHWYVTTHSIDKMDMTGLEELDGLGIHFWSDGRATQRSPDVGMSPYDIDAVAYWQNCLYYTQRSGHYQYTGWKDQTGVFGTNDEHPRYIEPANFNHNLRWYTVGSGNYGPREKHQDKNTGWKTGMQNIPQCGAMLNALRNTSVRLWYSHSYGGASDGRALNHYYKSLTKWYTYGSHSNYAGTKESDVTQTWQFKSCDNLDYIYMYETTRFKLGSLDFIRLPALRTLSLNGTITTYTEYLTAARFNPNLIQIQLPEDRLMSYSPYPYERVLMSVKFNTTAMPTKDSSRFEHGIDFRGTIYTDT